MLLRAGAGEVVAVDVGYGQLAWSLRTDDRVVVVDRTNVRDVDPERVGGPVDLVVGDLSFISLRLVLDALIAVTRPDGDLVLMVKPQFEVGKERLGKGGVVRDPALRGEAVAAVADAAAARGWGAVAWPGARCPAPRATSSSSSGCATVLPRSPTPTSRPPWAAPHRRPPATPAARDDGDARDTLDGAAVVVA